ncbi:HotDog domain-containing protein, partial [Mycena alexandri]
IEIIKDLPLVSGPGWTFKFPLRISAFLVGFRPHSSCITLTDEPFFFFTGSGPTPSLTCSSSFNIGDKYSKHIAGPPQGKPVPTDRKADWVVRDQTTKEQALVFRLSGDYSPLHIDPKIGHGAGFGGVILHGLSTFGFGARAVGGGDPRSLRFFGVRFTSPVRPGDALQTEAWEVGAGPQGTVEVAFVTRNLTSGKVVLGGGVAFVVKNAGAKAKL